MTKDEFNNKFRDYARTLSPQQDERDLVNKIYESFNSLLGINNCIQIGSYPRFTAITPLHDLDILYFLGNWDGNIHDPSTALKELNNKLIQDYENTTDFEMKISLQTHSVTVSYLEGEYEVLSVDIVPAYIFDKNEFNQDTYKVPEVIKEKSHEGRKEFYENLKFEQKNMDWITSDPRGYIKVAADLDKSTEGDFRKTVKIVKRWKYNLENEDESLKLKSFHLEQVLTGYFQENPSLEIFNVIFKFFTDLPTITDNPNKIPDRTNPDKFIDDYLEKFTYEQKIKIKQARDGFLKKLGEFDEDDSIQELFNISFYERKNQTEEFLFDKSIPILREETLTINGWIQKNNQDFRRLNQQGIIDKGLYIRFEVFMPINCDLYKWKVKNDNEASQPRGEITDHHTLHSPEYTLYKGNHFVECYAIRNGICVALARQSVIILH